MNLFIDKQQLISPCILDASPYLLSPVVVVPPAQSSWGVNVEHCIVLIAVDGRDRSLPHKSSGACLEGANLINGGAMASKCAGGRGKDYYEVSRGADLGSGLTCIIIEPAKSFELLTSSLHFLGSQSLPPLPEFNMYHLNYQFNM